MIASKMWLLECKQGFHLIWPGDLILDSKWPSFKLDLEIIKTNILSNIHNDYYNNVTVRWLTRFSFDLAWWPSLTNILSNIHNDYYNNVTVRWLTRFSLDLAWWPSFWPTVTSFELDLEIIKTNILSNIHDDCFKNVTAKVLTRISFDLAWWPSFWTQVTQFQTWPRNHQDKHIKQDSWWLLQKCES